MSTLYPEGFPPEGEIVPISRVDITVHTALHPFVSNHQPDIDTNWAVEIAANPALFNGQMVLQHQVSLMDGVLHSDAHLVSFASFMLWRKLRTHEALHLFGLPVIVSADGKVIAIRMAETTANPGRVYCAAGSLDEGDVRHGKCDVLGNMAREVREEIGLDLSRAVGRSGLHLLHSARTITVFQVYRFQETAKALLEQIERHRALTPDPEVADVLTISDPDPDLHNYPAFMPPILKWLFGLVDAGENMPLCT